MHTYCTSIKTGGDIAVKWYQLESHIIENRLSVKHEKGLTNQLAMQRLKQYGVNKLKTAEKESLWVLFMKQFQDFMVIILLAATLIAGMLGEFIDATAIMVIVIINGCIGFFQEQKAEKSLDKLRELAAPKTRVFREGQWKTIPAEDVVIGDIVRIKTGDRVPADIRIFNENSLEIEESALTGESYPVRKQSKPIHKSEVAIQDQKNMAFKGTIVTKGNATGAIVQTGMNTALGQIASLLDSTEKKLTPLELKLMELGKILIYIVLLLTAATVFIGIFHGEPIYDMFLAGVSLAVAVIPEGLPAIVTVALSLGVQRMIKRRAVVRKLNAVETLGCASIICTDKTGTITENKMTVKGMYVNNQFVTVSGDGYSTGGNFTTGKNKLTRKNAPHLEQMLLYGTVCNDAQLYVRKGHYVVDGDPTDGALLIAARKFGISHIDSSKMKVIKQFPFDAINKRISAIVEDENKRRFLVAKGAPEMIVSRCSHIQENKSTNLLQKPDQLLEQANDMATQAFRTIAIAVKPLQKTNSENRNDLEKEMTFIGFYGLIDPPRKEVTKAVEECRQAGIKTVMITGDHKQTAAAIAKDVGLAKEHPVIMEGHELNQMSVKELSQVIEQVTVFARVTPEHKLKIVKAFQSKGHIVAMTGDGVNDAPAIKASDIGISMGMTGTDVTKEASSLILMDDNFNTIKEAIKEGRNIYENIRKFIRYLLTSNVGEIFVMLAAMLMSLPLPLIPVQILWVNLVTDGFPALALGLDTPKENAMKEKPRSPKEGIFARGLGFKILSRGLLIGIVSLAAFMISYDGQSANLEYARTITFTTLVLAQLIHVFDCRADGGIFSRNPFSNLYLIGAVLSSLILLIVVIYAEGLQLIFETTALSVTDWLFTIVLSIIPTILFGFSKKE